ncbi:MAG TPA: hypothetical protein VF043_27920 [Ktedonobacteraceae bacterium]
MPTWTFERLAQADRQTLENVLLAADTPDLAQLKGRVYDGYNHDWLAHLLVEKFRKAFYQHEQTLYGFNQVVRQDRRHERGAWQPRLKEGKPTQFGFYRVTFARDEPAQKHAAPYRHLAYFNYNIDLNPRWNVPVRSIRDYIGLPNAGDHSLLLGKAYLQLTPWLALFGGYFLLGHPQTADGLGGHPGTGNHTTGAT